MKFRLVMAAFALCVTTAMALGQETDKKMAKGNYKIALVAPIEGSSVAADQVRVVLTPNTTAMGDEKTQVDVFLDGHQKGVIAANETEFRVEGVKPGPHKLVLIARNPVTDKQFDRREISFIATGVGSTTTGATVTGGTAADSAIGARVPPAVNSTERQHSYMATESTQRSRTDMTASSSTGTTSSTSETRISENRPSSMDTPASSGYSSSPSTTIAENRVSSPASSTYESSQLPDTASSDGLLALAGAALLVAGALVRRFA